MTSMSCLRRRSQVKSTRACCSRACWTKSIRHFVLFSEEPLVQISLDKAMLQSTLMLQMRAENHVGTWRKHLLESAFAPPCSVASVVDLSNSTTAARRKLVRLLNICLPVSDNEVRILQRMSLNFGKWTYQMPLARKRLQEVAKMVRSFRCL